MDLSQKTAAELSVMLRNKECSAVEIFNDVNKKIEEKDGDIKAYLTLNKEGIKTAENVDKMMAEGKELPPLAGIPISVKDNISTKGIRTTCASKILGNYIPPFNATIVDKINSNHMPIVGKTNMDEFAMGSSTETSAFQVTKNPADLSRVPGGSSGGAAASVAADETILAIGSDTGGSIRQPASFCGVVGFKPTYGTVSRYGLIAYASSLDQIGPFAKSVEDAALLQDLLTGHDKMDATSVDRKYESIHGNLSADIRGMKIGIPKEYFGEGIDGEVKASVMAAVKELESAGAKIVEVSLPTSKYAINAYYIIASAEASSNLARYDGIRYGYRAENFADLEDLYVKTRSEGFGDEVKRRIMLGTFVLSSGYYDAYYNKARKTQKLIISDFNKAFEDCDILATPTAPTTAFKIGQNTDDPVKMYYNDILTVPVNIAGLPAMSLPCGKDSSGLPVSIQLIGNRFDEQKIFNAAYAYEKLGKI